MSYGEVANELIKRLLPLKTTPKQLAAFQNNYTAILVEKLKEAHDGSSNISQETSEKVSKDIPSAFETFIKDNKLFDDNVIQAPTKGTENTLIQRTILPDEHWGRETIEQSIRDSVKADLFAWRVTDLGVGVNNDMMLDGVRAFNDIRMRGELYCPKVPDNLGEPVLEGNFLQNLGNNNEVVKKLQDKAKTAFEAAKLLKTKKFLNYSNMDFEQKLLCPFDLPRRNTPFVPINTLQPYRYSRDISMNGIPIPYMEKQIFHEQNSSMREPLLPDQEKHHLNIERDVSNINNYLY